MSLVQIRHLALARAALQHAIYFLDLEAHLKVELYLEYAADQFKAIAQSDDFNNYSESQ